MAEKCCKIQHACVGGDKNILPKKRLPRTSVLFSYILVDVI
jgi:hypothetical protein